MCTYFTYMHAHIITREVILSEKITEYINRILKFKLFKKNVLNTNFTEEI